MLYGLVFLTAPAHAQVSPQTGGGCSGNNEGINVRRTASVTFLTVDDLKTLVGTYCDQSVGVYATGTEEFPSSEGEACSVTITPQGDFLLRVGGRETSLPAGEKFLHSNGMNGVLGPDLATYIVGLSIVKNLPEGEELTAGSVTIQANRIVQAGFQRQIFAASDTIVIERAECAFHEKSHAGSLPSATISYASGKNIAASLVGTNFGTARTFINGGKDFPCSLTISSGGDFRVDSVDKDSGDPVTAAGKLRGRWLDRIDIRGGGVSIIALEVADGWRMVQGGGGHVGVDLDSSGNLVRAAGNSGQAYHMSDCTFGSSSFSDISILPICNGADCLLLKGGVGDMSCQVASGNPINTSSGNKFQRENDYVGAGSVNLRFDRVYNSHISVRAGSLGTNWRSNFDRSMQIDGRVPIIRMLRANGQIVVFRYIDGAWRPEPGDKSTLTELNAPSAGGAKFAFKGESDDVEYYDQLGRLVQISARGGSVQRLSYDTLDRLITVVDDFGHALIFTYRFDDRLASMEVPGGGQFIYQYDGIGNLVAVTGPGNVSPVTRRYFYENAQFPNALTGIEDENGKRFATWKYDGQGRAYYSEHAGGVDRTTLVFGTDGSTTVIDGLDAARTIRFNTILGAALYAGQTQPAGAGCAAASSSRTFDEIGNVKSSTDFNGVVTTYDYESTRRLVTVRTEAFGRPEQRTTTTEWHAGYRVPKRIASPKRIESFDYYPNGSLKTLSVQATDDETGARAFTATPIGAISTTQFTYNAKGQVEQITGPRSGGIDKTTFAYDLVTGDLLSVKNALGHQTVFGDYDASGRARSITTPNGMVTRLTFTSRGLLETQTVSDGVRVLTTTFGYDNIGQLKSSTFPDNSSLYYNYDDAHRLTDVIDSAGNTIRYELNNLGSREREEVRDASGTLKRRIARVFDALNRVKSETGGSL